MKKFLLQYLLLLLPVFVFAQNNQSVFKDFIKSAREISAMFKMNDHVWVIETNVDKESSQLTAVDNHMQILWQTTLDGYSIGAGKFMGHIVAVSASKYIGERKGIQGPYTAFLIDEKTGKTISSKIIFDRVADKVEFPRVFCNEDGSNFTFVIRQSMQGPSIAEQTKLNIIRDLTVIKLDDKLNPTVSSLKFPDEEVVNMTCNNKGDLFLLTHVKDDKIVKVTKYDSQKFESNKPISLDIDMHDDDELKERSGVVVASAEDRNVIYLAIVHRNHDKDDELTVSKFNFGDHTGSSVNEPLTRAHIKEIEKAYVPFDKKQDKPDIGPRGLLEKYITESNGTLVVVISNQNYVRGTYTTYFDENSLIINGYDTDLKAKFQQLMPSSYGSSIRGVVATHFSNNSLYVVTTTGLSMAKFTSYYGQLDLTTGNWLKLAMLPKKDISGMLCSPVMWFNDGFIIPYQHLSLSGDEINLQLNSY